MKRPGEDTLIRYFRGLCTPEEAEAVQLYLAMGNDEDYVKQCLQEAWGDMLQTPGTPVSKAQLEARWQQLEARHMHSVRDVRKPFRLTTFMRYAAVLAVLLTGALVFYLSRPRQTAQAGAEAIYQAFHAPKGKVMRLKLSDGSLVKLFPGSEIRLADNFNEQERAVQLKGRAFFEVTQDEQRPFSVTAGHLSTKVLGTSFEVNTDVEAGSRVTLLDGRVSVSDAAGEIATLDPGQQVLFNKLTHKWQVKQVNAKDIAAWTTGEFIYEHAPLQQVFRDIQNWYDVTIDADLSSLRGKTITTNFKDLPLEQVLTMISKASGLRCTITGRLVLVSEEKK
ncbi:FecR family protein [Chitinophaga sp. 22620]|uniref:FecR family protein n=1 Tax=Chitinophaga sp. 22620 TaxID=3453952 RepID=UPI003F87EE4B